MKNYHIDIQIACNDKLPITKQYLKKWAILTLKKHRQQAELTIRLVTINEITTLNHQYRQQNRPTNILAFPFQGHNVMELKYPLLGDIIICPAILLQEVENQPHHPNIDTALIIHWAHITIHGILHLLGFDHSDEQETLIMQTEEINLLEILNFDNPYQGDHDE